MRKISLSIFVTLILLSLPSVTCFAEPLPAQFDKIVESLSNYAFQKGLKLEDGEDIKDVVTLGYLNALNRLKAPFGTLDDKIMQETVGWLSILCWFPIIPPDKKKKAEKNLKIVRKALSQNSYRRTLAEMSFVPGFAVTSVGEFLTSDEEAKYYPYSKKGKKIYDSLKGKGCPSDIVRLLNEDKVDYSDLFDSTWIETYLK